MGTDIVFIPEQEMGRPRTRNREILNAILCAFQPEVVGTNCYPGYTQE
jgi:hypothetical protein